MDQTLSTNFSHFLFHDKMVTDTMKIMKWSTKGMHKVGKYARCPNALKEEFEKESNNIGEG